MSIPPICIFCNLKLDAQFFGCQVAGCDHDTTVDHSVNLPYISASPTGIP